MTTDTWMADGAAWSDEALVSHHGEGGPPHARRAVHAAQLREVPEGAGGKGRHPAFY